LKQSHFFSLKNEPQPQKKKTLDIAHALCYYVPVTKKKPSASHLAATLDRVEYGDLRGWILFRPRFHFCYDERPEGNSDRLFPMKQAHGSASRLQSVLEVNRY